MSPTRRVPVGRLALLLALGVGVWAIAQGTSAPRWRALVPGVEFALMRGEPYCRFGSSHIALLRLDPRRVRLRVLHYTGQPEKRPLPLSEWQRRLRALAVFNAGQYYPDFSYMGLLVSDGRVLSGRAHPQFRGALVAAPVEGELRARVLDLEHASLERERKRWRQIAQSFMLFDANGALRVRRTDQVANRTVVGEDRSGRLLVITTEGGYTLWEFAELLQRSPLGLSHAMGMDGGHEAELGVAAGRFRYSSLGRWQPGGTPENSVPLPTVVAVMMPSP